jgi:D-alanyl-D-alanine dipeptidase
LVFGGKYGQHKRAWGWHQKVGVAILTLLNLALLWYIVLGPKQYGREVTQPLSPVDMVILQEVIPGITVELAYASDNNIYGQRIYASDQALLRRGTAEKLKKAQHILQQQGYGLKVWDAYRPPEAQYKLWQVMPDRRYVINPYQGFSNHSRGVAVDVTLIDRQGTEVPMPTPFDDFTARADRDYSDISPEQAEHARLLEKAMVQSGFDSIFYEWWHFNDSEREQYGVFWEERQTGPVSP